MEKQPGTYALMLEAETSFVLSVGKLGVLNGRPGHYIYVGSAFGPGGLPARVKHHLRSSARPHWHIDYLRRILPITEVWYTHDGTRREHEWAVLLAHMAGSSILLPRFGASDCQCRSHLFYFSQEPDWRAFQKGTAAAIFRLVNFRN